MTTKEKILALLEGKQGEAYSGQAIADQIGISRTAVWKAIQTLKTEGYDIESMPNAGYRLAKNSDVLHAHTIQTLLHRNLDVTVFPSIDSTNAEAKRKLNENVQDDFLVLAEEQTAGRGRLGRVFHSPNQTGLYMSLVMHDLGENADATLLTTMAAVAVCRAIEQLTDKKPQIKWVNDIFLNGRKICGILTEGIINFETQTIQSIILGIGLNMTRDEMMPTELKPIVGSLFEKEEQEITRNFLAATIMNEFYTLYQEMSSKNYLDEYRSRCFVLGKKISFYRNKEQVEGKAVAIDNQGGLVVDLLNGEELTLSYGEISIVIAGGE